MSGQIWDATGGEAGRGHNSSALVISTPNNFIHLSQSALLLTSVQERASPCVVWVTEGNRFCLDFFPPLLFLLWGFFPPFVLIKEGSGMCPVCTVYYRHRPAGTLVLLGFPAPVPGSTLIPSDLAWQRQEVQKKGGHCSRKVRAKVEKQHVEIFSYLIKTQNASVSIFPALALASFLSLKNHLPRTPHLAWWQP